MPPGPAYNWFCVVYSALNILSHAAKYQAAHMAPRADAGVVAGAMHQQRRRRAVTDLEESDQELSNAVKQYDSLENVMNIPEDAPACGISESRVLGTRAEPSNALDEARPDPDVVLIADVRNINSKKDYSTVSEVPPELIALDDTKETYNTLPRNLQSSKVPSSRIGRLFHYGGKCPISFLRCTLLTFEGKVLPPPSDMELPLNFYGAQAVPPTRNLPS
ncbi:hypothetical protein M378DRAFT_526996 [Amanita muscaria Koide BX008]|uniref:Uncharacterized protein n=1 Tax=Amanita muscaria (strain Koide BX008) TaxID=946122 RepID=A0A0C2WUD7_AMAMK|nr:hypothetical protein M378DRAFT_526996 [Amanita muscaria Koide BX008]